MSEAIYDGRQRCGDGKQTGVAAVLGQKGIDGGVVTSSLDLGSEGGGTDGGREAGLLIGGIDPGLFHPGFQVCFRHLLLRQAHCRTASF